MAGTIERSQLYVEGKDDSHAIRHLLIRHGIDYDQKPWPTSFPSIDDIEGKDTLLKVVKTAVSLSNGRSVGFVLDANASLQSRWNEIASRLRDVDLHLPGEIPAEGFVGESTRYRARVGVWLMPDNQREGTLEHFLETLVEEKDLLFPHAEKSARQAKRLGARYSDTDTPKAVLHTWLAWQDDPGLPYGSAIRARYFRHDSAAAKRFVAWFRSVFQIAEDVFDSEPDLHSRL